ncbi:hypothetical protein CCMA1212_003658 [Trichoderma ghanense]|uniref:Uncharacterized protein n=1 Tax=Trichoderma ghanense TaxID=65468 RepID=A0ABY2H8R3_9HYPO
MKGLFGDAFRSRFAISDRTEDDLVSASSFSLLETERSVSLEALTKMLPGTGQSQ